MKRPWMPFYPADFRMDTLDLGVDEVGAYMGLILLAWHRGDGSVTADLDELKTTLQRMFANFHGLTFNRIVPKLLARYFELRGGRYYQKRVEKELRKAEELSEKQSRNAKERWSSSRKNNNLTNANAMPSQPQSQPQSEKKESCSNEFERFWKSYPRRVGKKAAEKALTKALRETSIEAIEQAIDRQTPLWADPKFIPHPATWLNQGRWADDLPEAAPKVIVSEEKLVELRARYEEKMRRSL